MSSKLTNNISLLIDKVISFRLSWWSASLLICIDAILCAIIVKKVRYTEIDWRAYMEEVEGYLDGERDYSRIEGNTGPLVYPAGFLYVFSILRSLTDAGTSIVKAQCIFVGFYLINLAVIIGLYMSDGEIPGLLALLLILSKRVHSIFMLRMFNDCLAVLCGYSAIALFTRYQWRLGCALFSFGVSIKMNMLLYAPGVLLILLTGAGFRETVVCLSICAGLQLALGYPFLSTYPVQYLSKAFELSRVFTHKWTVNLKFLSEEIFISKQLSLLLLMLTICGFVLFAKKWLIESHQQLVRARGKASLTDLVGVGQLNASYIITTIFVSNFIGVVFARTLHYQFYCWYFHTIPYLLWHAFGSDINSRGKNYIPLIISVLLFISIEVCFNVYPATWWSSLLLQLCHGSILLSLYKAPVPALLGPRNVLIESSKAGSAQGESQSNKNLRSECN